jgi:hypothetical protein
LNGDSEMAEYLLKLKANPNINYENTYSKEVLSPLQIGT